ncbi:MAG: hypothetical protein HUJ98_07750 [Bacteroidaceae bacterium]|nr:hypothetical protein [Bacteroidaceae bacterium]
MEFIESFMKFSFADEDVFCIEKDSLVVETDGIKACECVVLISPNVALIEAKASTPNPRNEEQYKAFLDDIRQKFADSLRLFNDMKGGKYGKGTKLRIPGNLLASKTAPSDYCIYVIVHGHQLDWLGGLQDSLREVLRDVVNEWNMRDSNVKAFNEEMALANNLIVAYVPKDETKELKEPNGNMDVEKTIKWFDEHKS